MQPGGGSPYPPPWTPYGGPASIPGWTRPFPPPPRPRGIPSVSLFMTGAIGHFLAAGMALPFAMFVLVFGLGSFFGFLSFFVLSTSIVMTVALVLHLIGFYGLWRNYGSRVGAAAFVVGIVATIFLQAVIALAVLLSRSIGFLLAIFLLAGYVLLGVMFILEGSAFIVNRHYSLPGAAIAAGVLLIIAGGFLCSIVLAPVGGVVAMPAFIIGGIVLVRAPVPMVYMPRPPDLPAEARPPMSP